MNPPITSFAPDLSTLDLLGRMPVPLRRPFKAGLDRAVAAHRAQDGGEALNCCFLSGAEWYHPFDGLAAAGDGVPRMLVSTFHHDILDPRLLAHYAPQTMPSLPPCHPVCAAAGLPDPEGVFRLFAVVPFVFLVDEMRLKGRAAPRRWSDLLAPHWAGDIVFGGWRPDEQSAYQEYNSFLLLALRHEFGDEALRAFAANVRHLQHNIRTATLAGSNSVHASAVAVLPWLQAELCPRRARTRVVWPEDGALAMPISYLVKRGEERRVSPLADYLHGAELGAVLARNCYPPANAALDSGLPDGARLKWPGWDYVRRHDMAIETRRAAEIFFSARHGEPGSLRACA